MQAAPAGFNPHELFTHVFGETQSVSALQVFLHDVVAVSHKNVPHGTFTGVKQAPFPSHADTGVTDEVVAHLASLHFDPFAQYAHAPPLQSPVVPHVV